jgi:drug/metabolite transporter (DMT)-like permease
MLVSARAAIEVSTANRQARKNIIEETAAVTFSRMKSRRPAALVTLVVLMIVWGSTFLVTKESVRELPPFTLGAARYLIATGTLALIGLSRTGRQTIRKPAPLSTLIALALSGVVLFIIGLNYAMLWGTVTQAALIYALVPGAVAMGAVMTLGEKLSRLRVLGITLSIAGVMVVIAGGGETSAAPHPLPAALAMLIVVIGWAVYTILAKRIADADQVAVMTWVTALGALMLVPFSLWELAGDGWPGVSNRGWAGLIFLGAIASGVTYLVYNWTLRHLEASVVGVLSNLDPIVGVLSAVMFLGETLAPWQIVGGIAALGGMVLASLQGDKVRQGEA